MPRPRSLPTLLIPNPVYLIYYYGVCSMALLLPIPLIIPLPIPIPLLPSLYMTWGVVLAATRREKSSISCSLAAAGILLLIMVLNTYVSSILLLEGAFY